MNASNDARISEVEIARVAQAIWESEGRPEGRDQEHWHRARQIVERGETFEDAGRTPRQVQPGFENAAPGMVPDMKESVDGDELREGPGGRFAKQLSDAPQVPGDEDTAAQAISNDPAPVVAGPKARSRARNR